MTEPRKPFYPRGTCLFCEGRTLIEWDPRLPLLRIVACRDCRDYLAQLCGWGPITDKWSRTWRRRTQIEYV